jgi:hypothetical protein
MRLLTIALTLALAAARPAPAQVVLFFDDFNGPALNPAFQASLPDGAPLGDGSGSCAYLGLPNRSFQTLAGASVVRLTSTLSNWQRTGFSTAAAFAATDFRLELRFNTLVQGPATSIDSFIEAFLIDPANPGRFDLAGPHGGGLGVDRQFRAGGSIDGQYSSPGYGYQDNTWYRLVVQGSASQNVRAALFADDSTTELIGQTLGHGPTAFPTGFRLGLAQATGAPQGTYPVDVAIDFIRLTGTPVPEPSALLLTGLAAAGAWAARRARKR